MSKKYSILPTLIMWLLDRILDDLKPWLLGLIGLIVGTIVSAWNDFLLVFLSFPVQSSILIILLVLLGVLLGVRITSYFFKRKNKQIEKNKTSNIITGDAALALISNLPKNQRIILREIYNNGGSIERDPFDGDLQALLSNRLVSRPNEFAFYLPCKWSIPSNVNKILRTYPDVLNGESPGDIRKLEMVHGFSKVKIRLIIRAFEADGPSEIKDEKEEIEISKSVQAREPIFELKASWFNRVPKIGYHYAIKDEWRAFLSQDDHLEKIKQVGGI